MTTLRWHMRAARVLFAVAAIAWLAGCADGRPPAEARSYMKTAQYADPTDKELGKYRIAVLGPEIEFVGPIRIASAQALETALHDNPQASVVRLTSPGGAADLAVRLERAIRARGLITYVPTFCTSACTMIFLGGRERYLATDARLGFHRGAGPEGSPAEDARIADAMKAWMESRGVANDFVVHAVTTPHTSMWYPTVEELFQAGIITAPTTPGTFARASAAERSLDLFMGTR